MARTLEQQQSDWKRQLEGAKTGNPYATLCQHCYGRHAPPFDELCQNESIDDLKRRLAKDTPQ